jgi:UDP-glucose 4-epimerase
MTPSMTAIMTDVTGYAGARVLVTGGLGFIGSTLSIELVRQGAQVTILDALLPQHGGQYFNVASVRDKVTIEVADMRDHEALRRCVRGVDYVFHLAGQVSHGDSMRDPHLDLAVNCVSTMNLVEICRQHNPSARLLYTSTRQVYGKPQTLPVTEAHPTLPIDVNGINKLAAEYYHLLYHRTYGLPSVVLRLTNTYGPRQHIRSDRQGFIGILIRQALHGQTLKVFGTGKQVRDFNYVDDVVVAMLRAAQTKACYGQVWNLGAPRYYSLLEFAALLGELCGVKFTTVPFPDDRAIIDIGDYYGDYSAFARVTGWHPRVDLPDGLARTVASYREHKEYYWA